MNLLMARPSTLKDDFSDPEDELLDEKPNTQTTLIIRKLSLLVLLKLLKNNPQTQQLFCDNFQCFFSAT